MENMFKSASISRKDLDTAIQTAYSKATQIFATIDQFDHFQNTVRLMVQEGVALSRAGIQEVFVQAQENFATRAELQTVITQVKETFTTHNKVDLVCNQAAAAINQLEKRCEVSIIAAGDNYSASQANINALRGEFREFSMRMQEHIAATALRDSNIATELQLLTDQVFSPPTHCPPQQTTPGGKRNYDAAFFPTSVQSSPAETTCTDNIPSLRITTTISQPQNYIHSGHNLHTANTNLPPDYLHTDQVRKRTCCATPLQGQSHPCPSARRTGAATPTGGSRYCGGTASSPTMPTYQ